MTIEINRERLEPFSSRYVRVRTEENKVGLEVFLAGDGHYPGEPGCNDKESIIFWLNNNSELRGFVNRINLALRNAGVV